MSIKTYKIDKSSLKKWIEILSKEGEIIAPKKEGNGDIFYSFIDNYEGIVFDFAGTPINTPKDFIFEHYKTLFKWDFKNSPLIEESKDEQKKRIIFARNCDIKAIKLLDNWFGKNPKDDTYKKFRENLLIIHLGCSKIGLFCFCSTFDISPIEKFDFDMQILFLNEDLILQVKNEIMQLPQYLKKIENIEIDTETKKYNIENIKNIADIQGNNILYDEIDRRCQVCDGCTFLCPACSCFDIADFGDETSGERVRMWDSCLFESFTRMAKGYNPLPTKKERWSHRLSCKLLFNERSCTGCGRCDMSCPGNIGMSSILSIYQKDER